MKLKRKQQGFTIIELLIVTVLIIILTAVIKTTFASIKQKERDTERTQDIKALQIQIEGYYAQNNRYPSLANMNDAAWRSTNMRVFDSETIKDPKDKSPTPTLAATPGANHYSYQVTPSKCTNTNDGSSDCTSYKLIANLETGGTSEKDSQN